MKQSLKLGLMVLLVALLAASGIALAQDSTDGSDAETTESTIVEEFGILERDRDGFGEKRGRGGFGPLAEGIGAVADVLGIEESALIEALKDGSSLSEVAAANGVDEATLTQELTALATDALDQAVADELITQERADAMLEGLDDRIADGLDRSFDRLGRGGHGHHHHPVARGFVGDEVSEILGLDKTEIHELIEGGQTLSEIAEAQDVDPETLIDAVTDSFRDRFSDKVYGLDTDE